MSIAKPRSEYLWRVFVVTMVASAVVTGLYASNTDERRFCQLPEPGVYMELQNSPDGTAYVVVLLKPAENTGEMSKEQRQEVVKEIQDRVLATLAPGEFRIVHKYQNFASLTGYVNAAGLAKLVAHPDVAAVGPDVGGHGQLDDSVPFINADDVHTSKYLGYTGEGITVAVLDTGIDSDHPDLHDNIAPGWYHFLKDDYGPGAEDDHGHGTNVAGIITSRGIVAPVGVAPDADILAIKVLDQNNSFSRMSDVVAGVDYVVSHMHEYDNLCVMNMSLGTCRLFSQCPCDSVQESWLQNCKRALDAAKNAGIVIFAASGNNGKCTQMPAPACLSAATAVVAVYDQDLGREPDTGTYYDWFCSGGCPCDDCSLCPTCYDATAYGDLITCFSNRSGCNELAAPGQRITSSGKGGGTSTFTGTSQAAPHCAGVAALMHEKADYLRVWTSPTWIVNTMKDSGAATIDLCPTSPHPVRVDALAAVNGFITPWVGFKWRQLPNTSGFGMDIRCDPYDEPGHSIARRLADDFLCTTTGPITKVILFASWKGDRKPAPDNVRIHLSIYDDIPDPDGDGPAYSKPGSLLWEREFSSGDFSELLYYTIPPLTFPSRAWWWDPAAAQAPIAADHKQTWRYDIYIDPCDAFVQQGNPDEPVVYWLGVNIRYVGFIIWPPPEFGWRTAILSEGWNDAAVWSNDGGTTWNELRYPQPHPSGGQPINLAFRLFGKMCCNCADYDSDGTVNFEDYSHFANDWTWSGPSGGGYNDWDLNCDGSVNFYDLDILARQWLSICAIDCRDN